MSQGFSIPRLAAPLPNGENGPATSDEGSRHRYQTVRTVKRGLGRACSRPASGANATRSPRPARNFKPQVRGGIRVIFVLNRIRVRPFQRQSSSY